MLPVILSNVFCFVWSVLIHSDKDSSFATRSRERRRNITQACIGGLIFEGGLNVITGVGPGEQVVGAFRVSLLFRLFCAGSIHLYPFEWSNKDHVLFTPLLPRLL